MAWPSQSMVCLGKIPLSGNTDSVVRRELQEGIMNLDVFGDTSSNWDCGDKYRALLSSELQPGRGTSYVNTRVQLVSWQMIS